MNPAVTLALATTRNFPWGYVLVYIVAEVLGATGAGLATWLTYGSAAREEANVGATYPSAGVSDGRAFVVEVLIAFILVIVVMAAATDQRVPSTATAALAVGFALAVGVFIGGPITGGAVNPARALGPMIVAGQFTSVWVYLTAPFVGGLTAAFLYRGLLSKAEKPGLAAEAAQVADRPDQGTTRPATSPGTGPADAHPADDQA